jgi:hypothetical protein
MLIYGTPLRVTLRLNKTGDDETAVHGAFPLFKRIITPG